ncbi:Tyrosine recombinase XerD [subsurface metagenome]
MEMKLKVLEKVNKGMEVPDFDGLVTTYEISNQAEGKSPRTIVWYTEMLMSFSGYMKVELQRHDLSAFNIDIIRNYIIHLRNKPKFQGHPYTPQQNKLLSPRTVQCHVRALKAFSTWLYSEGYTLENRLQNLKLPKAPSKIIEPLTPQEIKKIMSSINRNSYGGERNHTVLVTLLDSGLRASEAAGITLDNLNLKDGYIKVTGKGDKERIVPIGKFVQMELLHYIEKVRPQPYGRDYDRLFLSRGGKPITVNTVKLVFSRLAKSSGVNRLHAHLCRHTFAINYLLNGGDIFSLREILGHTTLDMVNHYLHFTSPQITAQHHKYSPMDRMQEKGNFGAAS